MDPREQRQVKLGIGHYQARQVGDKIVLHASGETPTPSYKVWLRAASDPGVAVHELWWREPAGSTVELPTPFSADVSFRAPAKTKTVRVRDAAGVHEIAVEAVDQPAAPSTTALVYLHYANQFDIDYHGKTISFTEANIAGEALLTYGDRYFYGAQITKVQTEIGELVSVILTPEGHMERGHLSVLLPPTWVSGYESSVIEALVVESVTIKPAAGPPAGQEVQYEQVSKARGRATFVVS